MPKSQYSLEELLERLEELVFQRLAQSEHQYAVPADRAEPADDGPSPSPNGPALPAPGA
jgi:hypothetical protein